MTIKWRRQYQEPERDEVIGMSSATFFPPEEDLTIQAFKDETDINVMLRRFGLTGQLSVAAQQPFYGDFTAVGDYQSALDRVRAAGEGFDALPPKVRARFANDPAELIGFMQDPANEAEARELGLIPKKKPEPVSEAPKDPPKPKPKAKEAADDE